VKTIRRFFRRLASFATTARDEARLREEIGQHIAMQTADNVRAGLPREEARRQALLKLGGSAALAESYRDQKGLPFLETSARDVRIALRRLRKAPAFTLAVVLTLSLGIGATTSIFTLVNAVLLKSLPVAKPEALYRVGRETLCCYLGGYSMENGFSLVSYDLYRYFRDHTKGFAELAAVPSVEHQLGVRRMGKSEAAQSLHGEFVSGNYFAMFGLDAYGGRLLTSTDDRPGAPPVAVISFRSWRDRYGSDSSVIGGVFNIDEKPFTVVGIAPPGFFGDTLRGTTPEFFLPLNTNPYVEADADIGKVANHWLNMIGRIQPGVSPAAIESEMRVELKQWLRSHWGEMSSAERAKFPAQTLYLSPGGAGVTSMREQYEHWLRILMIVSGFVLLIVCANVANLMLVRGMEQRRQTSLSMALGARASRVVRQALTESLVLAFLGGAMGVGVAVLGTRLILRFAFPPVDGSSGVAISAWPSADVLLFACAASLLTGIAFGIGPAWIATRTDPIEALRGASRATPRTGARSRKALMALQAALSLVLLTAAGLLTSVLERLQYQDFGFTQEQRIIALINPRLAAYQSAQLPQLYRRLRESVAGVPGVSSVALCLYSPLRGGARGSGVFTEHRDDFAGWDRVTPGFFETIGTPILRGRQFTENDTAKSVKVAVINEAFARKFFPNENPIGRRFGGSAADRREFEIVGVSKDARYWTNNIDKEPFPFFFLPEAQADYSDSTSGALFLDDIVIRTKPGARVDASAIIRAVAQAEPRMPVISVRPLSDQVEQVFTQQRLIARLTSFFGVLSLLLVSIGMYGLTAYNAGRRVTEIGVRMALGARRSDVVTMVLRGAMALIFTGVIVGLPLTFVEGKVLGKLLYGMKPFEPAVVIYAVAALGISAFLASLIPALRASFVSPVDALRAE
jgi:predicted permease